MVMERNLTWGGKRALFKKEKKNGPGQCCKW